MKKTCILAELPNQGAFSALPKNDQTTIITPERSAKCRGCFGCWLQTPGQCIIHDKLENAGAAIVQADEVLVLSPILYGSFSPGIKRILERSISGILPFFTKRDGRMHHAPRYKNRPDFRVIFYDTKRLSNSEKELAGKIAKAASINLNAKSCRVDFLPGAWTPEALA